MNRSREADEIRQQMAAIRGDLSDDVEGIVQNARTMTDWRYYVQTYPWACLAAAVAAGYLAVPQRVQIISPNVDTLLKLAKRNRLVVKPQPEPTPRGGLAASILSLLAKTVAQGALAYVGQRTGIKEKQP